MADTSEDGNVLGQNLLTVLIYIGDSIVSPTIAVAPLPPYILKEKKRKRAGNFKGEKKKKIYFLILFV